MKIHEFKNLPPETLQEMGGKARGLYYLKEFGFKVPKGFVVTNIKQGDNLEELINYWEQSGLGNVAVRSSATLEDGDDFSSAGQYQSFLNVKTKEEFVNAVNGCLSSLNDPNIIKYRSYFMQGSSEMSIVIQEMINPDYAGVSFSINPLTKENTVLIEVVEGLGEQLVSGEITAYSYVINRDNPVFENNSLKVDTLKKLYQETLEIETNYQKPIDLEFAIVNEEIIWLQARPITTLNDPTIDELDTPFEVEFDTLTNHNVGEMLPGAITPLTISTVVYAIDYGLRKMLTVVRVAKKTEDIEPTMCVSNYSGHLFFNMRYLYRIPKVMAGALRESIDMGICGQSLETEIVDDYPKKGKLKRASNFIRYMRFLLSRNKARKRVNKRASNLVFNLNQDYINLYQELDEKKEILNEILLDHYITSAHSGAMSSAIFTILIEDIKNPDQVKGLIASVLEDIDDIESVDILRKMRLLVQEMILDNPKVKEMEEPELINYLQNSTGKVKEAFDLFINTHGHRSVKEAELRRPGWKDDLYGLASNLKAIILTGGIEESKGISKLQENIDNITSQYKGGKKGALKYLIKHARIGSRNREYSKSRLILAVDKFKHAYKQLALKLVDVGALPDVDLIYFLTHDEIGEMINKRSNGFVKKALVRRRLFKEQEQLRFPHVTIGRPKPITIDLNGIVKGDKLSGTTLSRGHIIGKARVVKSLDDAKLLEPGEIMVAGYTDIGWSPYYAIIGGLVTEVGSALSHGAVVAREYALPLVSNVSHATDIIQTGDMLLVNADLGYVSIIDE